MEIFTIADIVLVIGDYICATQNILKCEYNFLILNGIKMAFPSINRNNAKVLREINRNVMSFSIKAGDIYNVESQTVGVSYQKRGAR